MKAWLAAGLLLCGSAACGMARRPRAVGIADIRDRAEVADQKKAENDPSAGEEYRAAIGLAEAAQAKRAKSLRNAFVLKHAGRRLGLRFQQKLTRFIVSLKPRERALFSDDARGLSPRERDAVLRSYASEAERGFLLGRLPSALREHRELATLLQRLRNNCGRDCR